MYVVILADTIREANAHARKHGLARGRFRFASSAANIRGLRVAEVHELPSFARRPDRYAIRAVLRYAKGKVVLFNHDDEPLVEHDLAVLDLVAPQETRYELERAATVAFRYEAIKAADSNALESKIEVESPTVKRSKPAPKPKATAPKVPLDGTFF